MVRHTEESRRSPKENGYLWFGILLLLDTEMVEAKDLEELQRRLINMKVKVDTYNLEQDTDHYVMVGLCTYFKEEKHRYSDVQIASANAII